ncbi:MAG: chloride channel protein [Victivallaceae bacterium]|nr:chloride channel protein [Victivallaceae bacterium]
MVKREVAWLLFTLLTGISAGVVALCYRLLLEFAEIALDAVLALRVPRLMLFGGWGIVLTVLAYCVWRVTVWNPALSGGGAARMIETYFYNIKSVWWKNIAANLAGGTLTMFAGLSIGQISPVIQLAASAGRGVAAIFKLPRRQVKNLMLVGVSSGFTAAFSAPLAGAVFGMTEISRCWSWRVLLHSMVSVFAVYFLTVAVYGSRPLFTVAAAPPRDVTGYVCLVVFLFAVGALAAFYNWTLMFFQRFFEYWRRLSGFWKIWPVFMLSGVLAFMLPEVLCSGLPLTESLFGAERTIRSLMILLGVKLLFSALSVNCGAPGGLIFPIIVIGALAGRIGGELAASAGFIGTLDITGFVVFGMCGMFIGSVRNPVTAVLLFLETTWQFSCLPGLLLAALICPMAPRLLRVLPVYVERARRLHERLGLK